MASDTSISSAAPSGGEAAALLPSDPGAPGYRAEHITHWDHVAALADKSRPGGNTYHRRLAEVYRFLIAPEQRVLEVGCGRGDLLAALRPADGVGVDFSREMIARAQARHPHLKFIEADAHDLELAGPFDAIILSDLINDLWDVQKVLERVHALCGPQTRIILNFYSRLWEKPLAAAQKIGAALPVLPQNWLTAPDVANLLNLAGFETMRHWAEVLLPAPVPLLKSFCNKVLVKMWPFRIAALTNFVMARPKPLERNSSPTVSVIVPARNEAGNIASIFARVPEMGGGTELIFVEGHSTDGTFETIERHAASNPRRPCKIMRQTGKGKGDAVRAGFAAASGDVLMILDADLTVTPEDLPRFFAAIRGGAGEFVNGVRLVYPMERQAMRLMNLAGNKFFSFAFSWLLGQPIKDTLCGTKVMWRRDYEKLAANRAYFGDFDPFGDFDLLFGAAKMSLKMVDMPIRYRQRTYGATNIQRWRHGWLLLKMSAFAAGKIKFV
ncbi:MAG TPA: glycosyltransferase [Tepidisphaeraceae bacterium]|nr:glycosyltransferase [Tepidisphaeraceae bacterium]